MTLYVDLQRKREEGERIRQTQGEQAFREWQQRSYPSFSKMAAGAYKGAKAGSQVAPGIGTFVGAVAGWFFGSTQRDK